MSVKATRDGYLTHIESAARTIRMVEANEEAPWLAVPENHPHDPITGRPIPLIEVDHLDTTHANFEDERGLEFYIRDGMRSDNIGSYEEALRAIKAAYELLGHHYGLHQVVFRFPQT